jgi:hypothetical protein
MNVFPRDSLDQGVVKLLKGLRFIGPDPTFVAASKGAVRQARDRLRAEPTVALFHPVCQLMAIIATPGAFLFALRLMAIDGSTEDAPDRRGQCVSPGAERLYPRMWGTRHHGHASTSRLSLAAQPEARGAIQALSGLLIAH